jgi:hypothetical protein
LFELCFKGTGNEETGFAADVKANSHLANFVAGFIMFRHIIIQYPFSVLLPLVISLKGM